MLAAIVMFATADFCNLSQAAQTKDNSARIQASENDIKAVFLFNFIKFTEWPAGKIAEPNTITIGLLGENQFGDAFDPVKDKPVKDKQLTIKNFGRFRKSFPQSREGHQTVDNAGKLEFANYIEQLRKCHVLFICDSERENYKEILDAVKGYGVLTVGETEDFLDVNGIITFIPGTEKPVFEINLKVCEQEGLKISSKVLRLARKVIADKETDKYK
jgi:YfiR/HmsC-like